jgi:hypothetical protein
MKKMSAKKDDEKNNTPSLTISVNVFTANTIGEEEPVILDSLLRHFDVYNPVLVSAPQSGVFHPPLYS